MTDNYHNHAARVSDASPSGRKNFNSYCRAHFLPHLPRDHSARILDVGCGYGRVLYFLRKEGYSNCSGIDASASQIEAARSHGIENIEQAEASAYLAAHKSEFDAILLIDILEHIPKREVISFLNQTRGALRAGGTLIVQTPNGLALLNPYLYGDFTHELCLTADSAIQVFELAGFDEIKVLPIKPHLHGIVSLARRLLWEILFSPVIRLYMLVASGPNLGSVYTPNFLIIAKEEDAPNVVEKS